MSNEHQKRALKELVKSEGWQAVDAEMARLRVNAEKALLTADCKDSIVIKKHQQTVEVIKKLQAFVAKGGN